MKEEQRIKNHIGEGNNKQIEQSGQLLLKYLTI